MPPNLFILFDCLSEAASSKKVKNGFRLAWHSRIWVIWLARNNVIIEEVKVISWKWSAIRLTVLLQPCGLAAAILLFCVLSDAWSGAVGLLCFGCVWFAAAILLFVTPRD
jgi:hypothetical protein